MKGMLSHMEAMINEVQRVWSTTGGDSRRMNTQSHHDGADSGLSPAPNALNAGQSPNTKETSFPLPKVEVNDVSYGWESKQANDSALSLVGQGLNEHSSGVNRGIYNLQLGGSRDSTERPVDSVVVKSAFYGKKLKSPYQEFILFELGNTQDPLDGASMLFDVQQLKSATPRGEFRFYFDGNREELFRRCDLTPYKAIETVEFPADDLPSLYELAIVTLATSLQRDDYHLLDTKCYWFTSVIWEQVLEMYPEAKHEILLDGVRGNFGNLYSQTWDSCNMNTQGHHDDAQPEPLPVPNAPNATAHHFG
ncbi:hypothetical protein RSOL_011240, partial [Rhizoctonia solani AG-3 Rhs1AP]